MLNYLKYPRFEIDNESKLINKISVLLKFYFTTFLFTLLSVGLITTIDSIVVNYLHQNSIWSEIRNSNIKIKNMFGRYSLVVIVIIIPFIEELIFRLPLNLKKSGIAISISVLYLRFSGNFLTHVLDLRKMEDLVKIFISLLIFFLLMNLLNQKKLDLIKDKYFKQYFYFIAISFGLIHIINFHQINYFLFFLYPIYVLPQFFMGLFIGNIRIKYGFIWGWALHALINSTSFLLP